MEVSVVIPVYNAAPYVRDAVLSALEQPETAEVLLIEDGSPDDSFAVCEDLAASYELVRLYRHPNGENRGASASRNLGIEKSSCDFIAFLDADDFYLPERFSMAQKLMDGSPGVEGVYEAIGTHFENDEVQRKWQQTRIRLLTTVTEAVAPSELFEAMLVGGKGYFSLDGLVVRRTLFEKTGLFDDHLHSMHEDTAMIYKMAAVGRLLPGRLSEPVAMRRVHAGNRISAPRSPSEVHSKRLLMWERVWQWGAANLDPQRERILLAKYLKTARWWPPDGRSPDRLRTVRARFRLLRVLFQHPVLTTRREYWAFMLPSARFWAGELFRRLRAGPSERRTSRD